MSGRAATENVIPGRYALSVGDANMPAPPGWTWTLLTDVARLESGHTPSRNHPEWWGGEVPWIGIRDAREHHGETIHTTRENTNADGLANSAARLLPAGTVCLSRTASVGYVVVMGREMATSQDFVNWVCSEAVVPDFLKHLLIAENESLHRFSKGTTHSTIYFPEVKAFHVCLPPVAEQKRIVAKLDALQARADAAKEALDAVPALLERFRQSVLAAAFRGDLTRTWRERNPDVEPASELLARIRAERRRLWQEANPRKPYVEPEPVDPTDLPELPDGWCWAKIDDVGELLLGRRKAPEYREEEIEASYLRVANVKSDRLDLDDVSNMLWSRDDVIKYCLQAGDILISEGQSLERIGQSAMVTPPAAGMLFQSTLHRLRANPQIALARYIQQVCLHWTSSGLFQRFASITTNIAHITLTKLREVPFPLCSLEEQAAVSRNIDAQLTRAADLKCRTESIRHDLTTLHQSILAKAFRGELVPQDPNDEPASALLERIAQGRAETPPTRTKRRARA